MEEWPTSSAADRWRRGVYTFWRRTSAYPTFTILDAPSREHCTVRRARSNTPLQALATLNDPAFVACGIGLACQTIQRGGATLSQRMTFAFRMCVARHPKPAELNRLAVLYHQQLKSFQSDLKRAKQLIGGYPARVADLPQLAAWTIVASVLLNLDETLTKG